MCVVCVGVTEGDSGDGCHLVSILCKYNLRKDDLVVLSWAIVRRVRRRSISDGWWRCAQNFVIASCG